MNAILRPSHGVAICQMLATCVLFSGCIEQSTVVKVKTDGSGLVHVRYHAQEVSLFGSQKTEPTVKVPTQQQIDQAIEQLGEGLALVSATASKNRSGWEGYELIFEFGDINQVVLPSNLIKILDEKSTDADDSVGEATAGTPESSSTKTQKDSAGMESLQPDYRFSLTNGRLEIRSTGFAEHVEQQSAVAGAVDPFAGEPPGSNISLSFSDVAFQEVAAKLLADARIGVFVEVDGKVTESNAKYRKANLITLAQVNLGEMLEDKEGVKKLKSMSHKKKALSRKEAAEFDEVMKGIDIDVQETISVQFE